MSRTPQTPQAPEPLPGAEGEGPDDLSPDTPAAEPVAGDRGIPSINRARSIQSQVTTALVVGLIGVLGFGFLAWYYAKALTRPHRAQHAAQEASRSRAQGEMPLPALPVVPWPFARNDVANAGTTTGAATSAAPASSDTATAAAAAPGASSGGWEPILGGRPPPPGSTPAGTSMPGGSVVQGAPTTPRPKTPGQLAFERRLAGAAFARASRDASAPASQGSAPIPSVEAMGAAATSTPTMAGESGGGSSQGLAALLRPTLTPAVVAAVLPTRRFLLSKGTFIDCTLETAIDSTLPGMTTCITATDTFSTDGTVVLLERGTKLVGETRGEVQQGSSRLFVLWTEARTPTGVVVPLSSPGTDELGRSGLEGSVNRHFWDRFGAALLLTVINGVVQGAVNSENRGGSVVVSPATSTDVMTEILRSTVSIPPTVTKREGDRIQVFVARDVDFRSVYALRTASGPSEAP